MSDTERVVSGPRNPSEMIVATDARGRKFDLIELDALGQLDLFEAAGPNSNNASWLGMAMMACSVRAIDGVPVLVPKNREQIRARVQKLGKDGIEAIGKVLRPDEPVAADETEIVETARK